MTDEEIIANEKYHTCGRCKWDAVPEDCCPCSQCIHGPDNRKDFWQYAESEDKNKSVIHCNCTDEEIAKSFIEDVEAVKDLLPMTESEDKDDKEAN